MLKACVYIAAAIVSLILGSCATLCVQASCRPSECQCLSMQMLEELDLGDMAPSGGPTPQPSTVWSRGAHAHGHGHGHGHAHDAEHDLDNTDDEGTVFSLYMTTAFDHPSFCCAWLTPSVKQECCCSQTVAIFPISSSSKQEHPGCKCPYLEELLYATRTPVLSQCLLMTQSQICSTQACLLVSMQASS